MTRLRSLVVLLFAAAAASAQPTDRTARLDSALAALHTAALFEDIFAVAEGLETAKTALSRQRRSHAEAAL